VEVTVPSLSGIGTGVMFVKVDSTPVQFPRGHVQTPPRQTSTVQGLLSVHMLLSLGVCTHPPGAVGEHVSSVHGFMSSQFVVVPPTHIPPLQWSMLVQGLPSSHGLLSLGVNTHIPVAGSHVSSVHGFMS